MIQKRHVISSVGTLVALGLLGACAAGGEEEKAETLTLAMVPKTSNNLVFFMGNEGAQLAAQDLSGPKRTVKVEYIASEDLEPSSVTANIRKAIEMEVDGLLVSCIDASTTEPINEAVAAGIPVLTFDSDCPDSDRLGFYSMASEPTGQKGADLLVEAMGAGPKQVAILTGRAGADNLERRVDGFEQQLADEYPDVEIVYTGNCLETAESCEEVLEDDIMENYPDIDGLFVVGLWGLLAACTCDESAMNCTCEDDQLPKWKTAVNNGLKTVAYDTLPFELELMRQGYLSALLGQKYFGWGYDGVAAMHDHLVLGTAVPDFIDSGFDVVCPNNLEDMADKWLAADFRSELEPCEL